MADDEYKSDLHHYLKQARAALLWKLEGLSEYDLRRPLVPTGTNLLGLVKHVAFVEGEYFGSVLGRPGPDEPFADLAEDAEPNADLFARPDETLEEIIALYHRVQAHSDSTIVALPLDATGTVPWWQPGRQQVTLHRLLVHMTTELNRHAGQADIVRELIDGTAGLREDVDNLGVPADGNWQAYRDRLESIARQFHP